MRAVTTPMYVDTVTYALTLAALIALIRGHDLVFCLLVAVGVTNRETALLLLPCYVLDRRSWATGAARLQAAAICGLPMLILVLLVIGKSFAAGFLSPGADVSSALHYRGATVGLPGLRDLMDLYSEFGILWLVTLAGAWRAPLVTRRLFPYAGLVVIQVLVARGDESRILSHSLPLVFLVTAMEITAMTRSSPSGIPRLVLATGFIVSAAMSMIHFRWVLIPWSSVRYVGVVTGSVVGISLIACHYYSSVVPTGRWARHGRDSGIGQGLKGSPRRGSELNDVSGAPGHPDQSGDATAHQDRQ